ncbi:MAG: VPLPA-CTERM sorting domain-containing protein, partial [Rubrivivax sp.]|nr:VPLPA-CTERM sorting domain-containing protein [Rubrivivax sp.]
NFFGANFSQLFVNNNGNVTFDAPLATFTPFPLINTPRQLLAPFFGDVDTRGAGSDVVRFGQAVIDSKNVFGVNWINVGYFPSATNKLNSFQLIITDRSDIAAGDFDFEFNYDQIQWETGGASGGVDGLGGNSARAGWSNGATASLELAGSAVNGAFLDGGPNALISGSLNSNVAGRYIFNVRSGNVVPVPEPLSLALVAVALLAAGVASRRRA